MSRTKQPNSSMCFICGVNNNAGLHLHIYEKEPGLVESSYIAPDHFQGYPGIMHGGIVSAIIDEIAGRSHMGSDATKPRFMFTARLEVKFRQHVPIGELLRIVGKAGRSRAGSAEAWGGIYLDSNETLLAEGNVLLIDVPASRFGTTQLDELGWKVYPDS